MQHRYTGDVGDFGKYGLLRALCGVEPQLTLGVNWYLVEAEEAHLNDGKHDAYLNLTSENASKYRACDPDLHEELQHVRQSVADGKRRVDHLCVSLIENSRILPSETNFYTSPLPIAVGRATDRSERQIRIDQRRQWHSDALRAMNGLDVVFVDPDNGLVHKNYRVHGTRGHKYTSQAEVADYLSRGQSLIVYHHLSRSGPHVGQVESWLKKIAAEPEVSISPWGLHYNRGTSRCYFIIPASEQHRRVLWDRSQTLCTSAWFQHFRLFARCEATARSGR